MASKVLAQGMVVKPRLLMRHRIVLRVFFGSGGPTEFVVHKETLNDDGSHDSFMHGSYFPVHCYGDQRDPAVAAFQKSYACFQKRDAEAMANLDFNALFVAPAFVPAANVEQYPV